MKSALFAGGTLLALGFAWLPFEVSLGTFLYEDMFYYLTLAEHALAGEGVTLDGSSPTNGFHPLWLLVCTALAWAFDGVALVHAVLTVAALLHVAQALLVYDLLRRTPRIALAAAGFWLLGYRVLSSNLCGLETPLATCAALLVLRELLREDAIASPGTSLRLGALAGLAALARFDLLLLLGVAIGFSGWRARTGGLGAAFAAVAWAGLGAFALLAPWLAWSQVTSGVWLPNSRAAIALAEGPPLPWGDAAALLQALGVRLADAAWWGTHAANLLGLWPLPMPRPAGEDPGHWLGVALLLPMFLVAVFVGLVYARRQPAVRGATPLLVFCALHVGYYVLFGRGEIRYLLPALAAGLVVVGLAVEGVLARRPSAELAEKLAGVALVLFVSASVGGVLAFRAGYGTTFTHRYHPLLLEAAHHLRDHTPPETIVGAWNAGILAFFSERTVVNLDGVVNDAALAALRDGRLLAYARERGVDGIVDMPHQFERFLPRFGGDPRWMRHFEPWWPAIEDGDGRQVVALRLRPGAASRAKRPPTSGRRPSERPAK